jgi:hypothetical protein
MRRIRAYQPPQEANPNWGAWHPPAIHNDPDPNPPLRIGKPVAPTSLGELYELHKRNGTLEIFYAEFGRGR